MDCIGFVRNPFIQFIVFSFTSRSFVINIGLQLIRGFVDRIGFVGNPFIQFVVFSFTSRSFVINIGLQLIRGFVDRIGFVRNPFIQFVVSCFTACHFVVVGSSQRCNAIGCVLVHLLDDCILGLVSPDPGCCFLCQGGVQVGHVFADGLVSFHDGPILNCCVVLAYIGIRCLFFQIFFYICNPVIQHFIASFDFIMDSVGFVRDAFVQFIIFSFTGCSFSGIRLFQISHGVFPFPCFFINSIRIGFGLCIQADQVIPYRIILFDISSVFGSIVGHTIRSHFTCYSHITSSGDIASRKTSRFKFSTDFHISDCLIFFSTHNQIATAGNMQGRAGLIRCKLIRIGFDLCIQCNDIFTYRIASRHIIPAGKGIINDALHADDFIFSGNIGLGNDFFTVDGRLGSQGTFDQSIAIHIQITTAVQATCIYSTAYIGVVAYADRIGHTGRSGADIARISHCRRILSPGEARAQKSCCHQQSCRQFLQSSPCGLALGVTFGDFRCHHIGVLCFAPDDFIDLIHVNTLL